MSNHSHVADKNVYLVVTSALELVFVRKLQQNKT